MLYQIDIFACISLGSVGTGTSDPPSKRTCRGSYVPVPTDPFNKVIFVQVDNFLSNMIIF